MKRIRTHNAHNLRRGYRRALLCGRPRKYHAFHPPTWICPVCGRPITAGLEADHAACAAATEVRTLTDKDRDPRRPT